MIDFFILGSGMAGSTIANLLSKNYTVRVFDKARGLGGRTSNKRFQSNLSFDHGAQYIAPKSKKFKLFINRLKHKNIIKVWSGDHLDFSFEKKDTEKKYIGKKANNDICKYQLKKIKTFFSSNIIKINYKKKLWKITLDNNKVYQSKGLIITFPYIQLKKLAKKYLDKKLINLNLNMSPNITVMIAVKNSKKISISSLKMKDDIIAWASNENSKNRFKSNIDLWTIQTSLKYSKKIINRYKKKKSFYINQILDRFIKLTGVKKSQIIFKNIHGWKYAYSSSNLNMKSYWNKKCNFGACGDWFRGPKIESAWLSSENLLSQIKKNPLIF